MNWLIENWCLLVGGVALIVVAGFAVYRFVGLPTKAQVAKIKEWLKAFAKKNCLVLMATQSLTDAKNSGILDVMVESTATKIFLPNVYAREDETAALYRGMGLNSRQIEILAGAIPKRQYYFVSEQGRRLYELALGPLALAFVGATDLDSINTIKKLEATFGDQWVEEWLKSRGVNLDTYKAAA